MKIQKIHILIIKRTENGGGHEPFLTLPILVLEHPIRQSGEDSERMHNDLLQWKKISHWEVVRQEHRENQAQVQRDDQKENWKRCQLWRARCQ